MAIDWEQIAGYLARVRLEAREQAMKESADITENAVKDAACVNPKAKKRKRDVSVAIEKERVAQEQPQGDSQLPWTAAECKRVWMHVVYGDKSEYGSVDSTNSGSKTICQSIADPSTFYADGWGECIAERQRAILHASFTVSGGELFRRRNHALAFQLAKDNICGAGNGASSMLSPRRRSDYYLPLYITAQIPSREKQGLGLRIEEIDMGSRQAVVMGEPHPWSEANGTSMSSFERDERAKICPGMELLSINGGELIPATLERAVELVSNAISPVQLTLRFPPEDASFKLYGSEDECFSEQDRKRLKGYYRMNKRQRASETANLGGRTHDHDA